MTEAVMEQHKQLPTREVLNTKSEFIPVLNVESSNDMPSLAMLVNLPDVGAQQREYLQSPHWAVPVEGFGRYLYAQAQERKDLSPIWEALYHGSIAQVMNEYRTPESIYNGNPRDEGTRLAGRTYTGLATLLLILQRAQVLNPEKLNPIRESLGSLYNKDQTISERNIIAMQQWLAKGKNTAPR